MKLKPVIKAGNGRAGIASWIVERFPENYREMTYIEPFLGDGSVFLRKDASSEEVLNDLDCGLVSVWRALRDEPKLLVSRLKKMKYSECTFKRHQALKEHDDYMSAAVSEFVLRQMSKSGTKRSFVARSEEGCKECWRGLFEAMEMVNERLKNSFILCKDAMEVLKIFSNEKTLAYCDPPEVDEEAMPAARHAELGDILKDFRGKVVISGPNSSLYKRIYSGWNRKGVQGNPKESIWMNF
jgi:DNA adenine methylase